MAHFPDDIKKQRANEREGKTHEERQTAALEQIADTVESMRIELVLLSGSLGRYMQRSQKL